jgi:hypothetical protein
MHTNVAAPERDGGELFAEPLLSDDDASGAGSTTSVNIHLPNMLSAEAQAALARPPEAEGGDGRKRRWARRSATPALCAPCCAGRQRRANAALLLGAYVVLFTRYTIATFLSSFFATVPPGGGFSGTVDGLIFAAYPLGMALTSVFAPQVIMRIGTRTAVYVGLTGARPGPRPQPQPRRAHRHVGWP